MSEKLNNVVIKRSESPSQVCPQIADDNNVSTGNNANTNNTKVKTENGKSIIKVATKLLNAKSSSIANGGETNKNIKTEPIDEEVPQIAEDSPSLRNTWQTDNNTAETVPSVTTTSQMYHNGICTVMESDEIDFSPYQKGVLADYASMTIPSPLPATSSKLPSTNFIPKNIKVVVTEEETPLDISEDHFKHNGHCDVTVPSPVPNEASTLASPNGRVKYEYDCGSGPLVICSPTHTPDSMTSSYYLSSSSSQDGDGNSSLVSKMRPSRRYRRLGEYEKGSDQYQQKRAKNNEAVKKSRAKMKQLHEETQAQLNKLKEENQELQKQLLLAKRRAESVEKEKNYLQLLLNSLSKKQKSLE